MAGYTPKSVIGKKLKCTCGCLEVVHGYKPLDYSEQSFMYFIDCSMCGRSSRGFTDMVAGKEWEIVETSPNKN